MADWLHENGAVLTLSVHVQPAAKRSEIVGLHGDALKVRLAAPAIDGRANAALIEFFAQRLGLAKSLIELKSGHQSRRKRLTLSGVSASSLRRLLGQ
ncbi:MAG: YggU family protein [Candidatus Accumulibacter sp.]|nr:YggU family protein [Accumulibacter sp.]MBN8513981.1 YggU family protein [Accumulibacter sp.]MBO3701777.1 YggU family protein [Accumulibacter sp.]